MIRHRDFLLLTVPETSRAWTVHNNELFLIALAGLSVRNKFCSLPPGTWQLIGLAAEITEEQKKEIVERWDNGKYADYERHLARVDTPDESFDSLLRSHNLNANQTLILKLIKP